MHYKLTKQYPNQKELDCARFTDVNDAKLAMNELFTRDFQQKSNVIYRLFDKYGDVIFELDTSKDGDKVARGSRGLSEAKGAATTGGSASSTSGFRPTPFSTTPTPPGGPQKWVKTEDEDKKDDEK